MLEAPQGATFVWCNGNLSYPRDLAQKHGRGDLKIVGLDALRRGASRLAGMAPGMVIIDHSVSENRQELEIHEGIMRLAGYKGPFFAIRPSIYD